MPRLARARRPGVREWVSERETVSVCVCVCVCACVCVCVWPALHAHAVLFVLERLRQRQVRNGQLGMHPVTHAGMNDRCDRGITFHTKDLSNPHVEQVSPSRVNTERKKGPAAEAPEVASWVVGLLCSV